MRTFAPPGLSLAEKLDFLSIPEPNSGCILWLGHTVYGYGHMYWGDRDHRAHRLAWSLKNGRPVPKGRVVCHKCDVRACINPDHLFVDTVEGNNRDKELKERQARGEMVNTARFTVGQILAIRADQRLPKIIAAEFGVWTSSIHRIKNRRTWKHVP
jgi:hypothetical protein